MPYEKATQDDYYLTRPMLNLQNGLYQNRKTTEKMWSVADSAPLLLKKSPTQRKVINKRTGKVKLVDAYRKNSALSLHTISIIASGAAAKAGAIMEQEAEALRNDVEPGSKRYPILPSVSACAIRMLDQAFITLCQEGFKTSIDLKEAAKAKTNHKKVTFKCARAGMEAMMAKLADGTAAVPHTLTVRQFPKVTGKPKQKAAPSATK